MRAELLVSLDPYSILPSSLLIHCSPQCSTYLIRPSLAQPTTPTAHSRLQRHAHPYTNATPSRLGTELYHHPTRLVSQTHGLLEDKVADRAVFEVVDVRAADPGRGYFDEDLVCLGFGDGALVVSGSWSGG